MGLRTFFQQNTTYNAADLRALIDALEPVQTTSTVARGLAVSYSASQLLVAEGVGFVTLSNAITGTPVAVLNTASRAAKNVSGGSTTWVPEASSTARTDIVYVDVEDVALDGAGADVADIYYQTGTSDLPSGSCLLLATLTSVNGGDPTITDRRVPSGGWRSVAPPLAIGVTTSDTNAPDSTWTSIQFNGTDPIDTHGIHLSSPNTNFRAPFDGWYRFTGPVRFDVSSTGRRMARLLLNSSTEYRQDGVAAGSGSLSTTIMVNEVVYLDRGDIINIQTWQNSGGTLGSGARITCQFISD